MGNASDGLHVVQAAEGFGSLALLWLAVVGGAVIGHFAAHSRLRSPAAVAVHHTLALAGLCLGAAHGFAQLVVPDRPLEFVDVVIPFIDRDDPIGIGVAVLASELIVAVAVSVVVRPRLGVTAWRAVHGLSHAAFTLLVAHVLISGSDVTPPAVWAMVLGAWLVAIVAWGSSLMPEGARRWLGGRAGSLPPASSDVTVRVDIGSCVLFGMCEHAAPDLFRIVDEGELRYRTRVPRRRVQALVRAIEACPVRAIGIGPESRLDERSFQD
jgi:ferredoxin/DMSO/TMAO reductase YedYZ heme-binding membrane subunit